MPLTASCRCGQRITGDERDAGREVRCPACGHWCELPELAVIAQITGDEFARIHEEAAANPKPLPVPSEEWADISQNAGEISAYELPRRPSADLAYGDGPFKLKFRGSALVMLVLGFGLMAAALCWFIAGMVTRTLTYYPPILFIVGLFASLRGLFDANLAGDFSNPNVSRDDRS